MYYVIPQFRVNCIEKKIAKCNARRRIWTTVNYSITEFIDLSSKSFRYGVPFEYFWSTFWNRILFFVTSIIFRNVSSFVCDNFSFVRDIFSYARNVFRFVRNVSSFFFLRRYLICIMNFEHNGNVLWIFFFLLFFIKSADGFKRISSYFGIKQFPTSQTWRTSKNSICKELYSVEFFYII